jgi:hypothetical protein
MNQLLKSVFGKTKVTICIVFFLIPHFFVGQNSLQRANNEQLNLKDPEPLQTISFGESIKFNKIDSSASWTISSVEFGISIDLKGSEINSYIFEKPGTYQISFSEANHSKDSCNHSSIPELFFVKVAPTKMVFDFSTLSFNKKLEAGVNLVNTEMTVDVLVKTFDNKQVVFENAQMISAGIGTTIVGKLSKTAIALQPGTNKLTYTLSGSATKDTYIMFDFFDINNQVQSYYFPTKL